MSRQSIQMEFEKIYQELATGIYRYVYFKVNDQLLAEDITSETFADLWQKLSTEEKIENYKAFLYFVAHSTIVDYYRSNSKKKPHFAIEEVSENEFEDATDLTNEVVIEQDKEEILAALNKIKPEYKDILLMYYIEELKVEEIAFALRKSENNIRVIIHRALKAAREVL